MNAWNLRRKFLKDFQEVILPIFKAYYLKPIGQEKIDIHQERKLPVNCGYRFSVALGMLGILIDKIYFYKNGATVSIFLVNKKIEQIESTRISNLY